MKQIDRRVEVHAEMVAGESAENGEQRIEGGKGKDEGGGELRTDEISFVNDHFRERVETKRK